MHRTNLIRFLTVAATALLSGALVVGCDKVSQAPVSKDAPVREVTVQLPWTIQAQFAGPIIAARREGEYKTAGLNVKLVEGGFNVNAPAQVSNGAAAFAIVQPDQLLYHNAQQTDRSRQLVAVATIYRRSMSTFLVHDDSTIRTIADFKGKRVGVKRGQNVDNELTALLVKYGLTRKDIVEVPVQYDLGLFKARSIDIFPCFSINEPYQAKKDGIKFRMLSPSDFGLDLYGDVVVTSRKLVESDPALVKAFVGATVAGWNRAFGDPGAAVAEVVSLNKLLDVDHQQYMLEASRALILPSTGQIGQSDKAVWESMIQMLEKYGTLAAGVLRADDQFSNEFLGKP